MIIIYRILGCLAFWFYIYSIPLPVVNFESMKLLFLIGLFFIILDIFSQKVIFINQKIFQLSIAGLIPLFVSLVSSSINSNVDGLWYRSILSLFYFYISYYFVFYLLKKGNLDSFISLTKLFVVCDIIQCLIALFVFLFPDSFGRIIFELNAADSSQLENFISFASLRLIGMGCNFFSAGIIHSINLCLILYHVAKADYSIKRNFVWLFAYWFIFAIGICMAKTTMVGFFLSFLFLLKAKKKNILKILKTSILLLFVLILGVYINLNNRYEKVMKLGFEIFINIYENKNIKSASTDAMLTMYIFPEFDNFKTWLIGDAVFYTDDGKYYMKTDIGYCRMIYCVGILGMIALLYMQTTNFLICAKKNFEYRQLFVLLWLLLLILNLKGFELLNRYIIPFYFINSGFIICKKVINKC